MDDTLRPSQVQAIGTHDSYHRRPREPPARVAPAPDAGGPIVARPAFTD